jgi:hypothetical protein
MLPRMTLSTSPDIMLQPNPVGSEPATMFRNCDGLVTIGISKLPFVIRLARAGYPITSINAPSRVRKGQYIVAFLRSLAANMVPLPLVLDCSTEYFFRALRRL